ncbi:GAF and ANTAR domain-containing protein [Streptomyces sp. NPDC101225]|uniref:GAF and ANTAR domain-containing protein n=1 Tax=Streptomyces sp. NPDC101225 TaxID=3366135 RepID=UPI00380AD62B
MNPRAARLLRLLAEQAAPEQPGPGAVCRVATEVCGVDEAALLLGRGRRRGTLHCTGELAEAVEDLQVTTGEGPGVDAWETRGPVTAADLGERSYVVRWPVFTPLAHAAGLCAVFVLPLQVGAVRLGTLSLYRCTPGGLSDEEGTDALLLSTMAVDQLLALSSSTRADGTDGCRTPGADALGLGAGSLQIYQATGMAAAQLGLGLEDAFARLRASAFSGGRPLAAVARDVVNGVLDFTEDDGPGGIGPAGAEDR